MAVADPASLSTRVGAKVPSAQASEVPASAARAASTRIVVRPGIRVASAAPKTHRSPLPADAELVYALGEGRVRRLVMPHEVVPLVLVGEVAAVHEQLGVLADLVGDGRVEVMLRLLVPFEAGDAPHVLRHGALRAVVVGDARLESLALVPEDRVAGLGRVVLERNLVARQIALAGVARRVGEVELHSGIGQQPRKEREALAIIELHAVEAVARALNRLGDRHAIAAIDTVRVRQAAIDRATLLDEALHIDVEELERNHARRVHVVLEVYAVVRGAPRVELRIAVRVARRNLVYRARRGFLQRVVERQSAAPLAQIERQHVLGVGEAQHQLVGHVQREVDRRQDVGVAAIGLLGAIIGGLGEVWPWQAGQMLGDLEVGFDEAHANVTAVPHAAELPAEVGLQIACQLLHPHVPGASRRLLCRGIGIERVPERRGIVDGPWIDPPEGDPRRRSPTTSTNTKTCSGGGSPTRAGFCIRGGCWRAAAGSSASAVTKLRRPGSTLASCTRYTRYCPPW